MAEHPKTYLGDGLYVEDRGYDLRLYADNGIRVYNEVFLDRGMLAKLNAFAKKNEGEANR